MHELGILYHVVEQVLRVAKENEVTEIEAIVLQVGELASVIPRYLHACYPAAVDGTLLENTKLEIEILPANAICRGCGKVFAAGCGEPSPKGGPSGPGVALPKAKHTSPCTARQAACGADEQMTWVEGAPMTWAAQTARACPHCAAEDAELISGQEFYIKEIRAR